MKFALPIKFFQTFCVAATIVSGALHTEAQTPPPVITNVDFPAIGTADKITAFAVHTVNKTFNWSWAYKTNGQSVGFYNSVWYGNLGTSPYIYGPLTNKAQLDQQCRSNISLALSALIASTDTSIDKSQGLTVLVDCKAYSGLPSLDTFYVYYTRVYLAGTSGSYSLPDLSGISSQINDDIPLYLPGLQWARYEIGYAGENYPFEVDDDRLDPTTYPITSDGFLDLPTGYTTNSSSANGAYWMKISTFANGRFYIWNGDGTQMPETPFKLVMSKSKTNVTVTVNGGDSGRGFVLQSSPDLTSWTNCGPVIFISPTNDLPGAQPSQFFYPATNRSLFFRTATTNLPPM